VHNGGPRRWDGHAPRRPLRLGALAPLAVLCACSSRSPSALDPHGDGALTVAHLWWLLFWIALVVILLVTVATLWAVVTRRGARPIRTGEARNVVVVLGVVIPAVILVAVYGVGLRDQNALVHPGSPATVTVDVTGHIWWWEARYEGSTAITANEFHIPVGQVVHFRLTTADVNHSFWVPQLMPKTDLVAGRVNDTWVRARRAGTFKGQCAEFCGLQHAHMDFTVVAQQPADYRAWLAQQAAPAPAPQSALAARGLQVLETGSCASCHTVRGSSARGAVGPDLTHLATRSRIGGEAIPNTRGYLGGWILNSQAVKPGNKMPPQSLSPEDLQAVLAYLEPRESR
jgi:cytochrome c oxidase subunit 2